jgi:hypothetical protein
MNITGKTGKKLLYMQMSFDGLGDLMMDITSL